MRVFKYLLFTILFTSCCNVYAHVGSPGVNYQGKAGKYTILVNIAPPDVIPGIATINVYVENYKGETVSAQVGYYMAGEKGSAMAEAMEPVKGANGWFVNSPWIMSGGTVSINITVSGKLGIGSVKIPVMAAATSKGDMTVPLGITLIVMGLLLFVLMATIIGACVSDAIIKPGGSTSKTKNRKYIAITITSLVMVIILYGAYKWCKSDRLTYQAYLYKPIKGHSKVFSYNGQNVLQLGVTAEALKFGHERLSFVIPDHGKIMHLVLVKEKTLDVFAHLHPLRKDTLNFLVNLPDIPAGRYFLYGDVVSWNGFAETITDTVIIPAKPAVQDAGLNNRKIITSTDDSWLISKPIAEKLNPTNKKVSVCGDTGLSFKLADGSTAIWNHAINTPFKVKQFCSLKFNILDPNGKAALLQPYMGMLGHAIVIKYDGSVYAHLHPVGNFAMSSQELINSRMNNPNAPQLPLPDPKKFKDSIDKLITKIDNMTEGQRNNYLEAEMGMDTSKHKGMDMAGMDMGSMDMQPAASSKCGSVVEFPYSFPAPGKYRIWMQVKINGKILTADFDTEVTQ